MNISSSSSTNYIAPVGAYQSFSKERNSDPGKDNPTPNKPTPDPKTDPVPGDPTPAPGENDPIYS